MSTPSEGRRNKELRLAVAMRGGVSLAVWMGGACCELARLRAAAPGSSEEGDPTTAVYSAVLEQCEYEDVDIDVLAGTSAGGLNGVLLACHLVYGMPFGPDVRRLWLELGDLEGLLNHSTPLHTPPSSLMRGDKVFYGQLRAALDDLLAQPPDPGWHPARSLRLILTATRLRPRRDWVRPNLGQLLLVGRSHAYFRFRHRPGLTDFPADLLARELALDRLAYAARTSSSFPGAFEPARMYVGNEPPPPNAPPRVNMRGVSSETGYPDDNLGGCTEMIDGGLLDNIPVAWAVRAVGGAPVERPADRWLLFLQPVPPFPPKPERGTDERVTRLVRTAAASFAVKSGSESLRDDALELRAAAAAQQPEAVAGVLPRSLIGLIQAGTSGLGSYLRTVGLAEAGRLVRLLEDPAEVTGPDALPLPSGPGPLRALDESAGPGSVELFTQLRLGYGTLLPTPHASPLALARAVRLLLDWVRAREGSSAPPPAATSAACRRRLHTYRSAVATLIAARDRLLLRCYADALAGGALPENACSAHRDATLLLQLLTPALPAWDAAPEAWQDWSALLAAAVAGPGADLGVPGADPEALENPYAPWWDHLAALGCSIGLSLGPGPDDAYLAFRQAATAPAGAGPGMPEALTAAEVLTGPLRPDPLAEANDLSFHTISAANASWATREVFGAGAPLTPQDLVAAKLSGNQLSNFAAFLSARWRISDWTWGRLDAASSLISVVATDERLAARFGAAADDTALGVQVAAAMPPGSPFALLWANDLAENPDVPRWDRVRGVLTAVRQREILDEELPMIAHLQAESINLPDLPPDPPPLPDEAFAQALDDFQAIGAEKVSELVRARDPRRAALRAGLLAWPAIQPSGRGRARVAQNALALLKPLLVTMPLLSILAPATAFAAVALMWTGAAFGAGRWSSMPAHVPLCLFATAALVAAACRLRGPAAVRWPVRVAAFLAPAAAFAFATCHGLRTPDLGTPARSVTVGLAYALAAALLLQVGSVRPKALAACAAGAGVIAAAVQAVGGVLGSSAALGSWWVALVLYGVLGWITTAFPWLYPRSGAADAPLA